MSLTVFSQTGTSKVIDTCKVTMSCETARKVAVDLLKGDSAKAELKETQSLLLNTEKKVALKDSIINAYVVKTNLHRQEIAVYDSKEDIYKEMVFKLQKDTKRARITTQIMSVTIGALIVTTIVGFIR